MKMKVMDLSGSLLNALVYRALVAHFGADMVMCSPPRAEWSPATLWQDAGPIIERQCIVIDTDQGVTWRASSAKNRDLFMTGCTPILAAMRVFVATMLGEEVEL